MGVRVGNVTIPNRVLLAPMAGITDLPFRRLAARLGAGLTVSEMVASREMVEARGAARGKARHDGDAAVQLAGREAVWMAEAARMAEAAGARLIDLNMGCPAKKVTSGACGAALMREPDHAVRLLEAVVAAVSVPVTVKMRLGWDGLTAPALARRAEAAGAAMITVHGRTRAQFYAGAADWAAVAAVRAAVSVPVAVNGDVLDAASARAALAASGAAAVMVGRGARGAPWLAGEIAAALAGRAYRAPDPAETMAELYDALLAFHGRAIGLRVARKHLGWTLARLPAAAAARPALMRAEDPAAVRAILRDLAPPRRAAA